MQSVMERHRPHLLVKQAWSYVVQHHDMRGNRDELARMATSRSKMGSHRITMQECWQGFSTKYHEHSPSWRFYLNIMALPSPSKISVSWHYLQ